MNIQAMNYVEFISLLRETNRCPGGKDTIRWILQNSFANSSTRVLEIGSNTGFSSLEVARTVKCPVIGIDPVYEAVKTAQMDLLRDDESIQKLVTFGVGTAYDIPCDESSIDLIIAGGSTSFMDNKKAAINEMSRVLRPWGMLSATNLYYHTPPPKDVLDSVSETIGVRIEPTTADQWQEMYVNVGQFELYKYETTHLKARTQDEIEAYVNYFMAKPHLSQLPSATQKEIRVRWTNTLQIFNENHKYLGFIKALLRKRTVEEEPELFKLS